jgi:ribosomal protein L39E
MGGIAGLWVAARRGVRVFNIKNRRWRGKKLGIDYSK